MNEVAFLVYLEPLPRVFFDGEELEADDHALVVWQGLHEHLVGGSVRRLARLLQSKVVNERLPVMVVQWLHVALSLCGLDVDDGLFEGEGDLVFEHLIDHLCHALSKQVIELL